LIFDVTDALPADATQGQPAYRGLVIRPRSLAPRSAHCQSFAKLAANHVRKDPRMGSQHHGMRARRSFLLGGIAIGSGLPCAPLQAANESDREAASGAKDRVPASGVTAQLAAFAESARFENLPADVVRHTRRVIADTLACALGGRKTEAGRLMADIAAGMGGPSQATLMGHPAKISAAAAAFGNGYLGNVLDADDTFLNSGHPAVCSLFPALALTESRGLSGAALIAAVAVGFDVGVRVGLAQVTTQTDQDGKTQASRRRGLGWYSFCAAISGGKALGLDRARLAQAMGLVGFTTPVGFASRWQSREAGKNMMKYSPVGYINFEGVTAAQLAEKGFTGDEAILDGDFGWSEMSGSFGLDAAVLTADLGRRWWIAETSLKPYSVGRFAHHAVDLFRRLQREHALQAQDIARVDVLTFEVAAKDWFNVRAPRTTIDLQFSIPMALAATAHGSDLGPEWQSPQTLRDAKLLEFAQKVHVAAHPDAAASLRRQIASDRRFRQIPNRVTVTTRSGQTFSAESVYAWGDPWEGAPAMSDDDVRDKFRRYAKGVLPRERIEAALDVIFRLETISNVGKALGPLLRA
jgi:2-methylcitrate dehydratase PrpD